MLDMLHVYSVIVCALAIFERTGGVNHCLQRKFVSLTVTISVVGGIEFVIERGKLGIEIVNSGLIVRFAIGFEIFAESLSNVSFG